MNTSHTPRREVFWFTCDGCKKEFEDTRQLVYPGTPGFRCPCCGAVCGKMRSVSETRERCRKVRTTLTELAQPLQSVNQEKS